MGEPTKAERELAERERERADSARHAYEVGRREGVEEALRRALPLLRRLRELEERVETTSS